MVKLYLELEYIGSHGDKDYYSGECNWCKENFETQDRKQVWCSKKCFDEDFFHSKECE